MNLIRHEAVKDQYPDLLKNSIKDLANRMLKKYPEYCLYSDSAQNQLTFEVYRAYPEAQKKQIYDDFLKYQNIMDSILENDTPISNKSALWVALKMFGLPMLSDDLFSRIDDHDVIEVYRYDGIQVFRNLNFHDICSYELPELFIYKWDELYYRHENHTKMIAEGAQMIFSGAHTGIMDLAPMGTHFIYELFSPKKFKLEIGLKYFYPLRNKQNQVEYGVSLSSVTIRDQNYVHTND